MKQKAIVWCFVKREYFFGSPGSAYIKGGGDGGGGGGEYWQKLLHTVI